MKQSIGLIRWFDNEKGFGSICTAEGKDVFIHIDQFINTPTKIQQCETFLFDIVIGNKGLKAENVFMPKAYDHFRYIMSLREKDPTVLVESTTTTKNKWGRDYIKKDSRKVSIFNFALSRVLSNNDSETVQDYFIKYFDENSFNDYTSLKEIFEVTRNALSNRTFAAIVVGENTSKRRNIAGADVTTVIFNHYILKADQIFLFDIWKEKSHFSEEYRRNFTNKDAAKGIGFPTIIFSENYKKIDPELFEMLLNGADGENLCHIVLEKKIQYYFEVSTSTFTEIKSCINKLPLSDSRIRLDKVLFTRNLEIILRNSSQLQSSDYFEGVLSILNLYPSDDRVEEAIAKINANLADDQIFKYWQEYNYFKLSADQLNEFSNRFFRSDFYNAPPEFHKEVFIIQFKKLHFDSSHESFYKLVFLLLDIPGFQIKNVEVDLPNNYRAAIWLYDTFFEEKTTYGTSDIRKKFKSNFTKLDFFDYLKLTDSFEELRKLLLSIRAILTFRENIISSTDTTSLYLEALSVHLLELNDIIKLDGFDLKFGGFEVLERLLDQNNHELNFKFFAELIPKHIDLFIEENFKRVLKLEQFFIKNTKTQSEFYNHIYNNSSIAKQIILVLDNLVDKIDIIALIDQLKRSPNQRQFQILQKIFSAIHLDKGLITPELFKNFREMADNISLNLNVRLALYVILSLEKDSQFITDKTIFDLVSQMLNENLEDFAKISNLLDNCGGRVWKSISYTNKKAYWCVNINGRLFAVDNNMVSLGGKSYELNKEESTVTVNNIIYKFKWVKNENIFHTENYGIPDGVTFCDARQSQYDDNLKSTFYWCCNNKCFEPRQNDYNPFEWKRYTLRDFIKILNIPFDNDLYYRFVSVINRVNRLLEKLRCNSCEKLMKDAVTSEFAFYRVNTFHCTNTNCNEYHRKVYLTHCLNWKCLNIIDTRISKACSNGWYICEKCDSCCSQEKIDRRYQNLLTNASFYPNNPKHIKLKLQVDNKLGHLEKNEVYDFVTGLRKV